LGVRMPGRLAQEVAHMHVVEADPQNPVLRHRSQPHLDQSSGTKASELLGFIGMTSWFAPLS
jgi:hypothetical protein